MKIGILQQHNTADVADNKTRLAQGIIDLAHRGAELIVLQELHNSLYFCQIETVDNFDLAEPVPGPSTDFYDQEFGTLKSHQAGCFRVPLVPAHQYTQLTH